MTNNLRDELVNTIARYRYKISTQIASGELLPSGDAYIKGYADAMMPIVERHMAGREAKARRVVETLTDALLDMVWQFCNNSDSVLSHSFMSAEENAFDVLGLETGMTYEQARTAAKAFLEGK